MRKDQIIDADRGQTKLIDLGAATQCTKGTFMPQARESILIKDFYDEP